MEGWIKIVHTFKTKNKLIKFKFFLYDLYDS